ncbi:hypothetical protein SO802_030921 [Lithocarpus litseifolius]|uniref:Uncharacterized protein n=1 Tax=Lithocarpus litseifolius TaxID=425828 RepID=A0AAW2BIY2_9ROSI
MASNSNFSFPPPQSNGSTGRSWVNKDESSWLWNLIMTLGIILCLCVLIWELLSKHEQIPEVILHNLSVPKFQTLDSRLVAEWEAEFTIFVDFLRSRHHSPVFVNNSLFQHVEGFVSYKDHILAVNSTKIVQEEPEVIGQTTMSVKFSRKGLEGDQREVKDWVLADIRKDRDNGTVIFGMQLVIWTQGFKKSSWAGCSDLMVDFNQAKWVATWPNWPKTRDCNVTKWNRPLNSLY